MLPSGITPITVTLGIGTFFDGSIVDGTVTITAPVNVLYTPTGQPIFSSAMTQRLVDGEATFVLCPTDAPGLNRVDWTYKANVKVNGALTQPDPIYFTLPAAGPGTVDLDALVSVPSSAGTPVSVSVPTLSGPNAWTGTQNFTGATVTGISGGGGAVSSVVGQTGAVTGAQIAADPALAAAFGAVTVVNATGTADSAAIMAAFNGMKGGGTHATGTLVIKGHAALNTALDFDGGYADVENVTNWATAGNEQFRLIVNGSLTPAAGLGNAVSVHGFNGVVLDLNFRGGGQASDNALDVYNLLQADITVQALNFAGTVLHGDTYVGASNISSRRIRCSRIARVYANSCGQAIFWRGFESFGVIDDVWDDNCTNGSYFGFIADTQFGHYETFNPASQTVGLTFEGCNNINGGTLALGDRASDCLLKIIGNTADPAGAVFSSDFGSLFRVRASCFQPSGVTTYNAVKLVDVHSIDITDLWTFRSLVGLSAVGSNVRIKRHFSQTADTVALAVDGDAYNASPIVDVKAHYRFTGSSPVTLGSSLTGGVTKLSGHIESSVNQSGGSGVYIVQSAAGSGHALDVAGLTEDLCSHTVAGFTNHTNLRNAVVASLADGSSVSIPAVKSEALAQVPVTNTTTETALGTYTIPANTTKAGDHYRVILAGTFDSTASAGTQALRLRVGGTAGASITSITNTLASTTQTSRSWRLEFDLICRSVSAGIATWEGALVQSLNLSTGTVVSVGSGSATKATTVSQDLVPTVTYSTADPGNTTRAEVVTIQKIA